MQGIPSPSHFGSLTPTYRIHVDQTSLCSAYGDLKWYETRSDKSGLSMPLAGRRVSWQVVRKDIALAERYKAVVIFSHLSFLCLSLQPADYSSFDSTVVKDIVRIEAISRQKSE